MSDEGQGDPGTAIERVPLKVVPYFVEPLPDPVVDAEPEAPAPEPVSASRRKTAALGILSLVFAVLTVAAHVAAIVVASDGGYVMGLLLGYLAIGLSVVAVIGGVAALVTGRGRRWAVAAIVLGVIANPWVLLSILTAVAA